MNEFTREQAARWVARQGADGVSTWRGDLYVRTTKASVGNRGLVSR